MTVKQHAAKTRLSEAVIWDLHEEYYEGSGVSAWGATATPYHPTSNNFITEAFAEQAVAFLQDYADHLDFSEPLYIMELGSGTGCFSYNFIRALTSKLSYFHRLKPLKWVYVATDIVPKNLDYWKNNGAFDDDIAAGRVDFALFNAERDKTLELRLSGKTLAKSDFKNPVILIANYFFDSLRNDEFHVNHGAIEEALVQFQVPDDKFAFAEFRRTVSYRKISKNYYNHPVMDAILEDYRGLFEEASILFPVSSLRTLDNIRRLSGNRLVVLSADKGFGYPQYMVGHWEYTYSVHGSFSYMVNFDAIRRYFFLNDGELLSTADPDLDILLNVGYVLDGFKGTLECTRYYFEEKMNKQNLTNYLPMVLRDTNSTKNTDPFLIKEFRAVVQISNYDALTFDRYAPKLFNYLEAHPPSPQQALTLLRILEKVEANCYPLLGSGAPVWLGILYYKLQDYRRSLNIMEKSLKLHGPNACAYYYIASSYETHFNQPEKALACFNEALKLDPNDESTKAAIKRIRENINASH